ncbi:MAG: hypothetical protein ACR2LQ_10930, partial [Acidimicrobiales bacterium]
MLLPLSSAMGFLSGCFGCGRGAALDAVGAGAAKDHLGGRDLESAALGGADMHGAGVDVDVDNATTDFA